MNYKLLLKIIREKLIISQSELAKMLNVSISTVARWETGQYEPTIKTKRKIVELCKENKIEIVEANK